MTETAESAAIKSTGKPKRRFLASNSGYLSGFGLDGVYFDPAQRKLPRSVIDLPSETSFFPRRFLCPSEQSIIRGSESPDRRKESDRRLSGLLEAPARENRPAGRGCLKLSCDIDPA